MYLINQCVRCGEDFLSNPIKINDNLCRDCIEDGVKLDNCKAYKVFVGDKTQKHDKN